MYIVEPRKYTESESLLFSHFDEDKLREFHENTRILVGGLRNRYVDISWLDISVTDRTSIITRDEGAPGIRLQILGYDYIDDDYFDGLIVEGSHDYMIRRSAAIDPVSRDARDRLQVIDPIELDSRLTALILVSAMLDL